MVHRGRVAGVTLEISVIMADRVESLDYLIILFVHLILTGRRADVSRVMSFAIRDAIRDRIISWTSA